MPDSPIITHPLLRLGRLALGPGLHGLPPGSAESGLVVTATVAVPDAPVSWSYAWDVAWADAVREASELGADPATAQALERGAGAVAGGDAQVVVAANGEAVLAWRLPPGAPPTWWCWPTGMAPTSSRMRPAIRFRPGGSRSATAPARSTILIRTARPRSTMANGT